MAGTRPYNPVYVALMAALVLASPGLAGNADDPEVQDERSDLASQYATQVSPPPGIPQAPEAPEQLPPALLPVVNSTADLVGAWIGPESEQAFALTIEVADIPDDENLSHPLVDLSAHFRVRGEVYEARASLALPEDGGELNTTYALHHGDGDPKPLEGMVDADRNVVLFAVPKALVGDPGPGDQLDRFYLTSHVHASTLVLDRAPDPALPTVDEGLLDEETEPQADYGEPYAFGQYRSAQQPAIQLTLTPSSLETEPGKPVRAMLQVANNGQAQDTVQLTLGQVREGWNVQASASQVELGPGSSKVVDLRITPPANTGGQHLLTLRALSTLGADQELPIAVQVSPPNDEESEPPAPDDGSGTQAEADSGDAGDDRSPTPVDADREESEDGAPGPGALAVLGTVSALALTRRRRAQR